MQIVLNDLHIRSSLLSRLRKQQPKAIIEELRVHNGNAVADVVSLQNEPHCYEIKGETDKIERVITQGEYYNSTFRKITLVTTRNHLAKALKLVPEYWGLILAEVNGTSINLKNIRTARINPCFDKEIALQTLWKSEMLDLLPDDGPALKRKPRERLASMISEMTRNTELSKWICNALIARKTTDEV